jgi:hypothetical protein
LPPLLLFCVKGDEMPVIRRKKTHLPDRAAELRTLLRKINKQLGYLEREINEMPRFGKKLPT